MTLELMAHPNDIRVLSFLEKGGPSRFTEIKQGTGLESSQVSRALDRLVRRIHVEARTLGGTEKGALSYQATSLGLDEVRYLRDLADWSQSRRRQSAKAMASELEAVLA